MVYGIGRVDASGRAADRVVTGVLGWRCGDRLTLTAEAGVVIARRDPGGMVTVPTVADWPTAGAGPRWLPLLMAA